MQSVLHVQHLCHCVNYIVGDAAVWDATKSIRTCSSEPNLTRTERVFQFLYSKCCAIRSWPYRKADNCTTSCDTDYTDAVRFNAKQRRKVQNERSLKIYSGSRTDTYGRYIDIQCN
jgi:phage gp36-like protein